MAALIIYGVVLVSYIFFILLMKYFNDLIYVRILEYVIIGILLLEIIINND